MPESAIASLGFHINFKFVQILVTFPRIQPQIAQVEKHMSTPQQVSATPGVPGDRSSSLRWPPNSVRAQNEFIRASSEPGMEPVERSRASISLHWPEYAIEGALLGLFMISACVFTAILQLPNSPIHKAVYSPVLRRVLTGVAMGLTGIVLIYSPWGQRSGAHFNPAVTLTFLRLGKIKHVDAGFYFFFQFVGATVGVLVAAIFLGSRISDPSVQYAATYPGSSGVAAAALGELVVSFVQMSLVLVVSNHPRFNRLTGVLAGFMVATYIAIESPYSGMSMNPARTFGSALPSGIWRGFLIYLLFPPIAMLAAAQVFVWRRGRSAVQCCKLDHSPKRDCIFCGMKGTAHE